MKRTLVVRVALIVVISVLVGTLFVHAQESVRVSVWTDTDGPDDVKIFNELISEFEALNPHIEVELSIMSREDIEMMLPMALAAGSGPNVANYDIGPAYLGALAKANLVYDLTEAYAIRGWDERFMRGLIDLVTYDGKIVGIPVRQEAQGLWYNAAIFRDLGLEPPTTWDRLIRAAEASKEAGLIPISQGTKTVATSPQLLANIVYGLIPVDIVNEASTPEGSITWRDDPRFFEAVDMYIQWIEDGWLPDNPNALELDDYAQLFYQGRAAMANIGPWSAAGCRAAWVDGEVEPVFVAMPAQDTSFPWVNQGAPGGGYLVSATSNPAQIEASLDLLDYMFVRSESQKRWLLESGSLPTTYEDFNEEMFAGDPVMMSVWEAHNLLGEHGGTSGIWLDHFVAPEAAEVFNRGQQRLVDGVWDAEQFIEEISDATVRARRNAGL